MIWNDPFDLSQSNVAEFEIRFIVEKGTCVLHRVDIFFRHMNINYISSLSPFVCYKIISIYDTTYALRVQTTAEIVYFHTFESINSKITTSHKKPTIQFSNIIATHNSEYILADLPF